jgi:hypothetical protein
VENTASLGLRNGGLSYLAGLRIRVLSSDRVGCATRPTRSTVTAIAQPVRAGRRTRW